MNKEELDKVLADHKLWLKGESQGKRANLEGADLKRANLRGANLWGANLRGADLYEADLKGADLEGANLREARLEGADLEGAYLYQANLVGANLKRAFLYNATLYWVNLRGADLMGANLERAFLREVQGKMILTFSAGKHFAYCCDNMIKIGCETRYIQWWVRNYHRKGTINGYTDKEIKLYGSFIKQCEAVKDE